MEFKFFKLCGLFFLDGFLLIFLGQNPWLLASALVLNCYFALDQPLNLFVSQLLLQEERTILFFRDGMCFSWSMIWIPSKQGCYDHANLSNCSEIQISHSRLPCDAHKFSQCLVCFHFTCVHSLSPAGLKAL